MGWANELHNSWENLSAEDLHVYSLDDLWLLWGNLQTAFPMWRKGQCLFNALDKVRPDLASKLTVELDPFYSDDNINALCDWLHENWIERQPVYLSAYERDVLTHALTVAYNDGRISANDEWDINEKLYALDYERR